MKNRKHFGRYGSNRRKAVKPVDEYTEEYYDDYEDEMEEEFAYEISELDEDDEYIVDYENENDIAYDEYEEEAYAPQNYEDEVYESEGYESEDYEDEDYESEDYEDEDYESEDYEDEDYEPEDYEDEACESEDYEDEEYESEDYEGEEYEDEGCEVGAYGHAIDYAEDTENYYEVEDESDDYDDSDEYYESEEFADEYYGDEYYDDDSFDTAYGSIHANDDRGFGGITKNAVRSGTTLFDQFKNWVTHMSAFDAILAFTGVVIVVAGIVILSIFLEAKKVDRQIAAIAPMGNQLTTMGIAGGDGLLAMSDAALAGNFAENANAEELSSIAVVDDAETSKVSVSFVSVEKDLKIRFTDANTGELITGTAFEVTLTSAKGKKYVYTDDDMDGIIYEKDVAPGVFDAVVTSTDKYKFPTVPQQVTVKDKVEYVVINIQDEVKTEKQVNVAAEDTQKQDAAKEEEKLKDTVEWVESTKTPVGGTESYIVVDKTTIADPGQVSKAAARMLFDTLKVSLDKSSLTLSAGSSAELKGTSFSDSTDGDVEYKYTTEWKSSDDGVASVSGGKVTAKSEGTATITYTVTKKTITTTYDPKEPVEETKEISVEEYGNLSDEEKKYCTPIKDDADQIIGYTYKKVTQPEKKTSETTETASAECKVTVEAAKIVSGSLELSKSADSCGVGATLTVKPSKLIYTKQDGSTQTITENFPSISWSSSDKAVATVDDKGTVTGVKEGKTHISGQVKGIKGADGSELKISCDVEVTITASGSLSVTLDRTKDVYIAIGSTTTLVATVSNYKSDAGVTWKSSDTKVAKVDERGVVTGVAAGSVTITATTKEKNAGGNPAEATCVVTVNSNASTDTTTKLKDKNGNQIYLKNADGTYKEAVYADYYTATEFYIQTQAQYRYTGWQTIDGKTYFYDKNGNPVTGTQIIQGVTYNFGSDGAIATSVNGKTFGIDVSRHNGNIDWNAVKASGVDYVIIRCGYRGSSTGVLIEDQTFRTNIKGATAAGLKVGVYVFSQAVNEVEAVKEASLAVSLVKGYNLTYPIFIDTESSGGRADHIDKATRTAVVNAFCQTVASAGYKPGIYASKTWFEDKLNMSAIGNYKIWLAQYAASPTYKGRYDMWQYSSKGKISGINGNVDLNYSYLGY